MLTMHYYLLFDGPGELWQHTKTLYNETSVFRYEEITDSSFPIIYCKIWLLDFVRR